jgi:hypothetical protein
MYCIQYRIRVSVTLPRLITCGHHARRSDGHDGTDCYRNSDRGGNGRRRGMGRGEC